MKKLFLLLALVLSLTACGSSTSKTSTTDAEKSASAKPAVGDTAVFKFSRQGYVEGKVQSIDGTRFKLMYGQSAQTVDAVDVYTLPKPGAKAEVMPGDIVVAHQRDAYWPGAEVKSVNGDVIEVQVISNGDSLNVPPEKLIKINSAAAAEFKTYGQEVAFLKSAKTGRPHPPADYKPKAGQRVVAEWTDQHLVHRQRRQRLAEQSDREMAGEPSPCVLSQCFSQSARQRRSGSATSKSRRRRTLNQTSRRQRVQTAIRGPRGIPSITWLATFAGPRRTAKRS